ncbi:hypothetical protein GUJ93_ZPchr0006g45620 [Zizania palustris]|uniref:Uncharacterized protein n=1 Tax=Zizania palustris TaxID=103762 RepID=A0A8J5VNZ4_ZIZPA|nr:hypothetical protein GUJ93_ZPchr0006g45620 [Zizania palustris]
MNDTWSMNAPPRRHHRLPSLEPTSPLAARARAEVAARRRPLPGHRLLRPFDASTLHMSSIQIRAPIAHPNFIPN